MPIPKVLLYIGSGGNITELVNCLNLFDMGNLYIRGNNYTIDSETFIRDFQLTEQSANKTVQQITNCYDSSDTSTRRDTLDRKRIPGTLSLS